MRLCFGIFAKILNLCNRDLPQEKFVPRIAWAVDRQNSSLASGLDYSVDDPDGMEGNKSVVSKLLSCERPLILRDQRLPTLEVACERFKSKVMPHINEDMVAKAVLAILYIISKDETIVADRKETFKVYFGLHRDELLRQTTFHVPDFFARVLLYTTSVDNHEGCPYAKEITDAFIEKAVNESWAESKWDATTQTVEIMPSEEKHLLDEINMLSELSYSLVAEQMSYTDTGWLGVDESILFPSRCRRIKFSDPSTKAMVSNKLMQYTKLVHELTDCLMVRQQAAVGQTAVWPVFPDERMQDIRQRLTTLSNELLTLGIFSERLSAGQAPDSLPLKVE